MKPKTTIIALASLFLLISCNGTNKHSKTETLWENEEKIENTVVYNTSQQRVTSDTVFQKATPSHKKSISEDTVIYNAPATVAEIKDAIKYFRNNNKYKNWDSNDKKKVLIMGIVEKDGRLSKISKIAGEEDEKLRQEAIRLVENAIITPAKNEEGYPVRSYWSVFVEFPPK